MKHLALPYLLTLGVSLFVGCADDTTYDASLRDIALDVRAVITVDDERVTFALEQWHGSAAYAYEHCPVIDAQGEVYSATHASVPLVLTGDGGWIAPSSDCSLISGSCGRCVTRHVFELQREHFAVLEDAQVTFRVFDDSHDVAVVVQHPAAKPTLKLLDPPEGLRAGEPAILGVTPSPLALGGKSTHTLAFTSSATPSADFEATAVVEEDTLMFRVPEVEPADGVLRLDWRESEHLYGERWFPRIFSCEGVQSCVAHSPSCRYTPCRRSAGDHPEFNLNPQLEVSIVE